MSFEYNLYNTKAIVINFTIMKPKLIIYFFLYYHIFIKIKVSLLVNLNANFKHIFETIIIKQFYLAVKFLRI